MKTNHQDAVFDAITDMDPHYIEEAQTSPMHARRPLWGRIAAVAAVFAMILSCFGIYRLLTPNHILTNPGNSSTPTVDNSFLQNIDDASLQFIYGCGIGIEYVDFNDLNKEEAETVGFVSKFYPELSDEYYYESGKHFEIQTTEDSLKNLMRVIYTRKNSNGFYTITFMDFLPQGEIVYSPDEITKEMIINNSGSTVCLKYQDMCVALYSSGVTADAFWEFVSSMPQVDSAVESNKDAL